MTSRPFVMAALVTSALLLRAQEPSSPTFRAGVDLIQLDVSVLDKNRHPVRGLTAKDFVVLDEGKAQDIVAFKAVDVPDRVSPPAEWLRDVPVDVANNHLDESRIVVVVIDNAYLMRKPELWRDMKRLGHDVINQFGSGDIGAVVYTGTGRGQNFTPDRARLFAAVDRTEIGRFNSGAAPSLEGVLQNVADSLTSVPQQRKTVMFIGVAVPVNPLNAPELFRELQRANINVYVLDPTGLSDLAAAAASGSLGAVRSVQRFQDDRRVLAEQTGGRAIVNTNDPATYLPEIFEENSSYYLLGFQPTDTRTDRRLHEVTVKVANRPDLEVRTRKGYYSPTAKRSPKDPLAGRTELERTLAGGIPASELPLTLSASVVATADGRQGTVAIVTGVRQASADSLESGTIDVLATAFDAVWKERASAHQTLDFGVARNVNSDRQLEVLSRLTLAPGTYELRVAAKLDGRLGSVFVDVTIPDFSKEDLLASSLVIGRTSGVVAAPKAAFDDVLPVVPTAAREFSSDDRITAFLRFYQGGKRPARGVSVALHLLDQDSRSVFEDTTTLDAGRFGANRSADYQRALPTEHLAAGQYLLRIDATSNDKTVQRQVRFTIR